MWSGTVFSAECKTADFRISQLLLCSACREKKKKERKKKGRKKKRHLTMPRKPLCYVENAVFVFQAFIKFSFLLTLWKLLSFSSPSHVSCSNCLFFPNILAGLRQWPTWCTLLCFTIRPLQSSTCFGHYVLIIRRTNCIDAVSGIVLSVSGRPVHRLRENSLSLSTYAEDGHWLRGRCHMLHQYNSTSWWWACNARNM